MRFQSNTELLKAASKHGDDSNTISVSGSVTAITLDETNSLKDSALTPEG